MSFDDLLAFIGLCCFLFGVYLWLGLAAVLMVGGAALIFIGARAELPRRGGENEHNQKPVSEQSD